MIESLPTFLIIPILELLGIKSLGNILIASKKINKIFNNCSLNSIAEKKKIIQKMKQYCHEKNWNDGLEYATEIANREIIDICISKGANDWDQGMEAAAICGHQSLVEFFISKGADDWNEGTLGAICGGHQSLVDFFNSKRAAT